MNGTTRLISSAVVTSSPGLAGTPPTSRMSAPSATTSCTRARAAASSHVMPGRKNESGVRFTIAITSLRSGPNSRVPSRNGPGRRGSALSSLTLPQYFAEEFVLNDDGAWSRS